jgi:[CysO sulfur-carrier protein]-S-L-cysteine hydrolase
MLPGAMLAPMDVMPNWPADAARTVEHFPEGDDPVRPLVIGPIMRNAILAHLAASLPNEGCGLLAGMSLGANDMAVRYYPGTNIDHSPVRYTMKPEEVIQAQKEMRDMRAQGWFLAAIVHSHPRTPPTPSRTDLREAYYPRSRMLIVTFAGEAPELKCWALLGDLEARRFRETQLLIGER